MAELSILIPARNEMFLGRTICDILDNIEGDTEVIAILEGYWPDPPIKDDKRVILVHHTVPIGQRAATNEAAAISRAKYIMKVDAHCAFDKGFDVKLMDAYRKGDIANDVTTIPRMYNLHAFDWLCTQCNHTIYQGPTPPECPKCHAKPMIKDMKWKPRLSRRTDFARFDNTLHFQYWRAYEKRDESKGDIADVMCCVGAAWMMRRDRYKEIGGMDEQHGSWGQMGVELACKSWLSGGRQVVNKRTWFAHMFRTQGGDFGFPYQISGRDVEKAREYSRDLWINNKWSKATRPFQWILDHFFPVPDWPAKEAADGSVV